MTEWAREYLRKSLRMSEWKSKKEKKREEDEHEKKKDRVFMRLTTPRALEWRSAHGADIFIFLIFFFFFRLLIIPFTPRSIHLPFLLLVWFFLTLIFFFYILSSFFYSSNCIISSSFKLFFSFILPHVFSYLYTQKSKEFLKKFLIRKTF